MNESQLYVMMTVEQNDEMMLFRNVRILIFHPLPVFSRQAAENLKVKPWKAPISC